MTDEQNGFLKRLQRDWDNNNASYTEDGFKDRAVAMMDDYLIPCELDEVMNELDLSR